MDKSGLILVTGATGFLGGRLTRALLAAGRPVRAIGRNLEAGMLLQGLGADFRPVDITNRAATIKVCEGVTTVVHAAALASAWGKRQEFFRVNVDGTANVIQGCLDHGIQRLVYISSPSVMSTPYPRLNLTEADPLPEQFMDVYTETKKLGEDLVMAASGLEWVILRPKAIYGPGDNVLFPRLAEVGKKGRLPIIGSGDTRMNLTHVDDVVQAVILAMDRPEAAGNMYLITGGEEVNLWDLLGDLFHSLGYPRPSRKISVRKANIIADILTAIWRTLPIPGEPPLTRYKVSLLAFSQTYDISKARTELGYEPQIRLEDGIREFVSAQLATHGEAKPDCVEVVPESGVVDEIRILNVGICEQLGAGFLPGGPWKKIEIPALVAAIKHPQNGWILFDTGYATRFFDGTRRMPYRLFRVGTPLKMTEADNLVEQLPGEGIDPLAVRWIILSHFDPDHYGGLKDFPNARIICHAAGWAEVSQLVGDKGSMGKRIIPGHLPQDLSARLKIIKLQTPSQVEEFPESLDIFGDGTIQLVPLPGHIWGQLGAYMKTKSQGTWLLAADGCWSKANLPEGKGGVHGLMAKDRDAQKETYKKLRELSVSSPALQIIPAHCPQTADETVKGWRRKP
jgi:nucleoside-diphosphate-sugar epimerase/glyoxylase-like metal-dependent hydrolase (beta-lactamase superfamily II)